MSGLEIMEKSLCRCLCVFERTERERERERERREDGNLCVCACVRVQKLPRKGKKMIWEAGGKTERISLSLCMCVN